MIRVLTAFFSQVENQVGKNRVFFLLDVFAESLPLSRRGSVGSIIWDDISAHILYERKKKINSEISG